MSDPGKGSLEQPLAKRTHLGRGVPHGICTSSDKQQMILLLRPQILKREQSLYLASANH